MPSSEEFAALTKRVDDLQALVNRLTTSHKDVLEKYLPEAVKTLNGFIGSVADNQTELTTKLTTTMEFVTKLSTEIENIQNELELR